MSEALVVVTGLSGAGKSTALHTLEDLGFYCVDNLPPSLVAETVRVCDEGGVPRLALGMDARVGAFLESSLASIERLAALTRRFVVLFLDASDEVLLRRFSETRRPHPVLAGLEAVAGGPRPADSTARTRHATSLAVLDGVQLERERLADIRGCATLVVDTTHLSVHELRRRVIEALEPDRAARPRLHTRMLSFGFKYGVPFDADIVLDVRFLENPFFSANLRHKSGLDPAVSDFVLGSAGAREFVERTSDLLTFLFPRYEREGKSYLTVAVGCTGGRHRSVTIAVELAGSVATRLAAVACTRPDTGAIDVAPIIGIVHRDVARGAIMGPRSPAQGAAHEDGVRGARDQHATRVSSTVGEAKSGSSPEGER